jgi:hypothetical protein
MGIWHHTDKDGKRTAVELDAEQSAADTALVAEFQGLEGDAARGVDVAASKAHAEQVSRCVKAADSLPSLRKAHWRGELARIGAIPADSAPKAPAAAAAPTTIERK